MTKEELASSYNYVKNLQEEKGQLYLKTMRFHKEIEKDIKMFFLNSSSAQKEILKDFIDGGFVKTALSFIKKINSSEVSQPVSNLATKRTKLNASRKSSSSRSKTGTKNPYQAD